jgi:hypothetical protein
MRSLVWVDRLGNSGVVNEKRQLALPFFHLVGKGKGRAFVSKACSFTLAIYAFLMQSTQ